MAHLKMGLWGQISTARRQCHESLVCSRSPNVLRVQQRPGNIPICLNV